MENLLKWIDSHPKEAKRLSEQAEEKAWRNFKAKFPNADLSKFVAQVDMTDKTHATAQINLVIVPGQHWQIVSPNPKDWSVEMKKALGFGGFPLELILNSNPSNPVPAVPFSDKIPESFGEILNHPIKIFVKPNESFTTKFREIFTKTKISHKTGKESRKWLNQPNMDHWPQQLNFAFWCATTASGISRHLVNSLPPQIKSFLLFHIYFTTRRILFEMGGIQSESALPGDPTFSQTENKSDIPSYKRICAEFQISPNADFRFTFGQNLDLDMLTYFIQEKDTMHKNIGLILQQHLKTHQVKDSPMKAELTQKETELISSETIKELTNNSNFSCQTDLSMDFLKQEWQDSINQLKHSFIAFLEHKSTSDHQSWVNLEVQRKLKENFSSSWKMQSDSLTCQKASKDFSLRLMRQKSGLILPSRQEHG